MEKNVGKLDRTLRVILGLVLGFVAYYTQLWWLYIIALIPFLTGIVGYCYLYKLLNINTNKTKKRKR